MAIRDLLWACPLCKEIGTLAKARGGESCQNCNAHFSRGRGAEIIMRTRGAEPVRERPSEWVDQLPMATVREMIEDADENDGVIHREGATLQWVVGRSPVSFRGRYLNLIERLGPKSSGTLTLRADQLSFLPGEEARETETWEFNQIRAIQPSSSTLQIRAADKPLVSIEIPNGSIRFWEMILTKTIRAHYRKEGRGEIIEFQPRIVTEKR